VLGTALGSFVAGFVFSRIDEKLRPLAMAHRTAAAVLLVLAVPVAFTGVRIEIGWMALAIAFAAVFASTGSCISRWAAPIAWLLAVLRILSLGSEQWGQPALSSDQIWLTLHCTAIGSAAIMAWIAALSAQVISRLILGSEQRWRLGALFVSMIASLLWSAASIASLPALAASTWIIVYAWLLIGGDWIAPRLLLAGQAVALLVLVTMKWALVDTLANRLAPGWSPTRYAVIFNPQMAIGAAIAASLTALYFLRHRWLRRIRRRSWTRARPRGGHWRWARS